MNLKKVWFLITNEFPRFQSLQWNVSIIALECLTGAPNQFRGKKKQFITKLKFKIKIGPG